MVAACVSGLIVGAVDAIVCWVLVVEGAPSVSGGVVVGGSAMHGDRKSYS